MKFSAIIVGLLAEIAASAYNIPIHMEVADECALPSEYTISNFVTYADKLNGTLNATSFHFTDSETGIDTACQKNSTSSSTSPNGGTARFYCDDTTVEFIYQTTGIAGLTVIEKACPDRYVLLRPCLGSLDVMLTRQCSDAATKYEASGLTQFNLTCTATFQGTLCSSNQTVSGEFTSINPVTSS